MTTPLLVAFSAPGCPGTASEACPADSPVGVPWAFSHPGQRPQFPSGGFSSWSFPASLEPITAATWETMGRTVVAPWNLSSRACQPRLRRPLSRRARPQRPDRLPLRALTRLLQGRGGAPPPPVPRSPMTRSACARPARQEPAGGGLCAPGAWRPAAAGKPGFRQNGKEAGGKRALVRVELLGFWLQVSRPTFEGSKVVLVAG